MRSSLRQYSGSLTKIVSVPQVFLTCCIRGSFPEVPAVAGSFHGRSFCGDLMDFGIGEVAERIEVVVFDGVEADADEFLFSGQGVAFLFPALHFDFADEVYAILAD